jgi:hypothetical protein
VLHDVFICHASEDKNDFVRPLAEGLRARHVEVWYDEFSLKVGDSLRQAIDRGLINSQFGIVVLSPAFFRKHWTQRELSGLVAREMHEGRELVLPIWYGVDQSDIIEHSPPLADVRAIVWADNMESVIGELLRKLRPEESPLITARDFLLSKGVTPPIVTDEWWLDVVEFKEGCLRFPDLNLDLRWIFPLPHEMPDSGKRRGLNIAWTALQMDWMQEAVDEKHCQLTHPERIHHYLRRWPGLLDCCRVNPSITALYAPQLTIPGYDDEFADVFDKLLRIPYEESLHLFNYGRPDTVDGKEPVCGEMAAWRHPTFGNYTDGELASAFVRGHTGDYARGIFDEFTCLVWLLTDAADWLPSKIRSHLLDGMREEPRIWSTSVWRGGNAFRDALLSKTRKTFRFSKQVKEDLQSQIGEALKELGIFERPAAITQRFVEHDFVGAHYDDEARSKRKPWK